MSVVGATEFNFQIFDRWGQLVFETTDMYFKWDGLYKNQIPFDAVLFTKQELSTGN
ncbi:MAG: gliding motility-associated C-terminal domain-containing protein [Crocinitomicaceae bacterium]|nr:gliding motility-associated C-terminal domain-containing protein [Crocinitomicaceae bacterium]